jgi:hypothetical protein
VSHVYTLLKSRHWQVIDADLSGYFDEWHCRLIVGAQTELVKNEVLYKIRSTGDRY